MNSNNLIREITGETSSLVKSFQQKDEKSYDPGKKSEQVSADLKIIWKEIQLFLLISFSFTFSLGMRLSSGGLAF